MEESLHELRSDLSRYLQGFIHPRWCRISSINSMTNSIGAFVTAPLLVDENGKVLRLDSLNTLSLHLKNHVEIYTVVRLFLFHQETFYCFNLQQQQQKTNQPTTNQPTNQPRCISKKNTHTIEKNEMTNKKHVSIYSVSLCAWAKKSPWWEARPEHLAVHRSLKPNDVTMLTDIPWRYVGCPVTVMRSLECLGEDVGIFLIPQKVL